MKTLQRGFPLVAILVLAFNLRPVATSVGPVMMDLKGDLGLGDAVAGFLAALPPLACAVFGIITPTLSRRLGPHRTATLALALLAVGQFARSRVDEGWVFLALSALALCGMALGNVLVPGLVRLHYPGRVGLGTSLYSLSLTMGLTLASMGTVPLAHQLGGWRGAFSAWAALALAGMVIWLPALRFTLGRTSTRQAGEAHTVGAVARTRMGWAMALLFGLQSAQAYTIFGWLPTVFTDAGLSQTEAGWMLGLATGLGVIPAFVVPAYAQRNQRPVGMFLVIMAALVASYSGLILAPAAAPWLWATLFALGSSTFPLLLALLGLRARTSSGTTAMSGFVQSMGYLIAAMGPWLAGVLHGATGSWTIPLGVQLVLCLPMTVLGVIVTRRNWAIEDELRRG